MAVLELSPIEIPIVFGGLNSDSPANSVFPDSPDLQNVRWGTSGQLLKRSGFTTYNATAMPATTRAITGVFGFNRRDTTTRYVLVCTQEKVFSVPASGAWTTLLSGLTATATDYWDMAIMNNIAILVNGVDAPQYTTGTVAGSGALVSKFWQTRTALPTAQSGEYGLKNLSGGHMMTLAGASSASSYDGVNQHYDPVGDTWKSMNRASIKRGGGGGFFYGDRGVIASGSISSTAGTASVEEYSYVGDTWKGRTNITTARRQFMGMDMNGQGYCITGNTNFSANAYSAANEQYDPPTDAWATKTAATATRRVAAACDVTTLGYIVTGRDSTDTIITTNYEYNPFADSWTTRTAITNGRSWPSGASKAEDRKMYMTGGLQASDGLDTTTVQSYNLGTDAWTQENAITTSRSFAAGGAEGWWIYATGGGQAGTAQAEHQRLLVSPSPPVAFYVETIGQQCIMARTAGLPSRVFYSTVGDQHSWPVLNFIDVNPDDGDWITGMFVLNGRLYVSKMDTMYLIAFSVLNADPTIGDQTVVPLANVKGTVSNRSIVVTDRGVYYLAKDGFRLFDGSSSVRISDKIWPTINGYVATRAKYTAGVWIRARNEIWWSMTSTGSTHNRVLVYNYQWNTWSVFVGINVESIGIWQNASDTDIILFGTGTASDGKLYQAESTLNDNGAAINAYHQTGWMPAPKGYKDFSPDTLYLWAKRSGNWNLTVNLRRNYNTTNEQTETVNLLSGTYPDQFFQDSTDLRARVMVTGDVNGHAISLRLSNANASEDFEVYGASFLGHAAIVGGYP